MNLPNNSNTKINRCCPVCGSDLSQSHLFASENIDQHKISGLSYASRKPPELMSHWLVSCKECDLVYAPNPPSIEDLANAYHQADYDSSQEAIDAANSYLKACLPVIRQIPELGSALEIGSGTGIFLELLEGVGFERLVGVEPSQSAIDMASPKTRGWIEHGIFDEKNFVPQSFDLICCFMTLEHVADPMQMAKSVYRLLKPGGAFVSVTHDYRSFINRMLGMRSPIIDIEHLQLFSEKSIREMFIRAGYQNISTTSFINSYSIKYWLRLSPLPKSLKSFVDQFLKVSKLDNLHLGINVGNRFSCGYKRQ
jgi:SAM-dependent methyltransferase